MPFNNSKPDLAVRREFVLLEHTFALDFNETLWKPTGVSLESSYNFEKHSAQGIRVTLASGLLRGVRHVPGNLYYQSTMPMVQRLCLYLLSYIFIEKTELNFAGVVTSKGFHT